MVVAVVQQTVAETRVASGATATGSYRCLTCGHTVTVIRTLPDCEHCSNGEWAAAPWSPFAKART
jgi:Zn finger protein HypA/HybF involved in hydrogenase expression